MRVAEVLMSRVRDAVRAPVAIRAAGAAALLAMCCAFAGADTPASAPVTFGAFLSASIGYNFNRPAGGTNQLRVFDLDDREFQVSVLQLVAQRPAAEPGRFGFRADLIAGSTVPRITAARGLFRDDDGRAHDVDLLQAYVSWNAPLGHGLRVDAGKFTTMLGYEVIEGQGGWNENATRSITFGYGLPATHTGLRVVYPFNSRLTGQVIVVQGWDVVRDNNDGKTVGMQLSYAPPGASLGVAYVTGPERDNDRRDTRRIGEITASWQATPALAFGLDLVAGSEENASAPGADAAWRGAVLYARRSIGPRWQVAVRAEVFDDLDGARTGAAQRLTEVTLTPQLTLGPHVVLRADLRLDRSDVAVFASDGRLADGTIEPVKRQPTLLLNALVVF